MTTLPSHTDHDCDRPPNRSLYGDLYGTPRGPIGPVGSAPDAELCTAARAVADVAVPSLGLTECPSVRNLTTGEYLTGSLLAALWHNSIDDTTVADALNVTSNSLKGPARRGPITSQMVRSARVALERHLAPLRPYALSNALLPSTLFEQGVDTIAHADCFIAANGQPAGPAQPGDDPDATWHYTRRNRAENFQPGFGYQVNAGIAIGPGGTPPLIVDAHASGTQLSPTNSMLRILDAAGRVELPLKRITTLFSPSPAIIQAVADRGVHLTYRVRPNTPRKATYLDGVVVINGEIYDPAAPDDLIARMPAVPDPVADGDDDANGYWSAREALTPWRLQPHSAKRPGQPQRWKYPQNRSSAPIEYAHSVEGGRIWPDRTTVTVPFEADLQRLTQSPPPRQPGPGRADARDPDAAPRWHRQRRSDSTRQPAPDGTSVDMSELARTSGRRPAVTPARSGTRLRLQLRPAAPVAIVRTGPRSRAAGRARNGLATTS